MYKLLEQVPSKRILLVIILLSMAVFIGQLCEAGGFSLDNMPDVIRLILDQTQYFVGLMIISFLFIVTVIKKYDAIPNDLFRNIKWYFIILFINDFLILFLRVIQKSNIVTLQNGFSGVGAFYLILAAIRSVTDLVLTSAAAGILVWGLANYKFVQQESATALKKLGPAIIWLIVFKVIVTIPVSLTGIVTNRTLYIWSLVLSQMSQLAIAFLFYWVVKEHQQQNKTRFFAYLTSYFGLNFLITGLNFTYAIGSFSLLQKFSTGEIETLGGFGKVVLFMSLLSQVAQNYLMYTAIDGYSEEETIANQEVPEIETADTLMAGSNISN